MRAPIVDGTRELGEDAVVTVVAFGALGLCTGTLIAPSVVLTAKHCVQAPGADGPYPVTALRVGVGNDAESVEEYRVRYVDTTEGVYTSDPRTGIAGAIVGVDVGVLILREPVEGVEPIPIRRDRPDDLIGQPFTAIGFGQRPDGPAGLKYKTTGTLGNIVDTVLYTEQVICSGDSGGPMIQETPERRVVGVASFGQAGACPSSRDGYNALFGHLDLIDRALVLAGECIDLGDEACNSLDDDCDGDVDEGCLALGEPCAADDECAFAQLPDYLEPLADAVVCDDLGAGPVCARPCDPLAAGEGCGTFEHFVGGGVTTVEGAHCRRTEGCEGRCVPGAPGALADGEACGADTDCASLHCVDPGTGARTCLPVCRGGDGSCPVGEVCVAGEGACGACVDAERVAGARALGEPCGGDGDCGGDAICLDGACASACGGDRECPAGYRCEDGRCRRGGRAALGEPCDAVTDCAVGSECAAEGFCTRDCAGAEDCGDGLECRGGRCEPAGAVLGASCGADAECADGTCGDDGCTRACGAGAPCPVGFACRRDDEGRARCLRAGGGCAAAAHPRPAAPAAGWLFGLGLLGLLGRAARRRRSA
jgi:V8-like Glu-specific endopeptidase